MRSIETVRLVDRPACRATGWPLAVAIWCLAGGGPAWADDVTTPAAKSHIQTAGEMVTSLHPGGAAAATAAASPLGLTAVRAPDLLREHLALGHGAGLVVDDVVAGSSADTLGFKRHDVLISIDDQLLLVPEQLVVILSAIDTTAAKSCVLIRGGKRLTLPLDAPARPAAGTAAAATPPTASAPRAAAAPAAPAAAKRGLMPPASALAILPDKKKARDVVAAAGGPRVSGVVRSKGTTGLVQDDLDYSIDVTREDETLLTVRNAGGKTIFRAVIETPEQRSRIPLAVRDRVEQLEQLLDRQMQATPRPQPAAEIGRLDIDPVLVK